MQICAGKSVAECQCMPAMRVSNASSLNDAHTKMPTCQVQEGVVEGEALPSLCRHTQSQSVMHLPELWRVHAGAWSTCCMPAL